MVVVVVAAVVAAERWLVCRDKADGSEREGGRGGEGVGAAAANVSERGVWRRRLQG